MSSLRTVRAALTLTLALVLALALAACGSTKDPTSSPGSLEISAAWVRATAGTQDATMTGAFMEVANTTDVAVRLVGASSPAAGMAQVHTMVMEDGSMVMRELPEGLEVPAGSHVHLRPGGNHVMLMGLTAPLSAGEEITLTLRFSDGSEQVVTVPVKEFTEEEDHYHPSTTPSPSMSPMS